MITATDSGGTLEFVVDGENGFVCAPGAGSDRRAPWRASPPIARSPRGSGDAGCARARTITWDGVVEQLLG